MSIQGVFQAAVRDEWDGLERITRDLRLADFATMLNALSGLGAVMAVVLGHMDAALALILLGVILDGVDGGLSRKGFGGGPLGGTLDSLADAVTFVAAPIVVAAVALDFGASSQHALILVPLAFYALCGLLRLARFESMREARPRRYFSGLSSPGAAVGLVSLLMAGAPVAVVLVSAVLLGALMVSRIRYPKLRGGLGALAGTVILVAFLSWPLSLWRLQAGLLMLTFMLLYATAGPFYVLRRLGPTPYPEAR